MPDTDAPSRAAPRWALGLAYWLRPGRGLGLLLALAIAVHLPALGIGLVADDYVHIAALEGAFEDTPLGPANLYDFGSRASGAEALRIGGLPWWTSEGFRIRFLRPLPSLVRTAEHAIVGRAAWPGQLANTLALAALVALARAVYLRLGLAPGAALMAAFFVAMDESSAIPVGWLANRNSLLEALFGIGALWVALGRTAVDAPRSGTHSGTRMALAWALALAATLCKESGVVFLVLVPAAAWWRARELPDGPTRMRALKNARRALLAGCAAALVYVVAYAGLGYGASSRFYPEPWGDPLSALAAYGRLLLVGAGALASPIPADLVFVEPRALWGFVPVGALVLTVAVVAARRHRGVALLLALFALALLPQSTAPVGDRLLLIPGIGLAGCIADTIQRTWTRGAGRRVAIAMALLYTAAGPLSGIGLLGRFNGFAELGRESRRVARTLEPSPQTQNVLMLQGPHGLALLALAATWPIVNDRNPIGIHALQLGNRGLVIVRRDALRFEVESTGADFLCAPMEAVFRTEVDPLAVGRRWSGALFDVEALALGETGLARIDLRFPRAPEELGIELFRADWNGAIAVPWPAVGERVELPRGRSAVPFAP